MGVSADGDHGRTCVRVEHRRGRGPRHLLGAGLGAALGAAAGNAGLGAAVGAGGGLLTGTALGARAGQTASYQVQNRYDNAYEQCMYAKGNQVPAGVAPRGAGASLPPPPPSAPLQ